MKKSVKTVEVFNAYNILSTAKFDKLTDTIKVSVWKIARKLKPVAQEFGDTSRDCAEKMQPTEDFPERLRRWQKYNQLKKDGKPTIDIMSTAEHDAFSQEFQKYNKLVNEAMKESAESKVELNFEPISEDGLMKLAESNDWTLGQIVAVGDLICE
jgi:hypothetical protein